MAKEGRDEKGRFKKGNKIGINTEVAREYQLRAAEARKENRLMADAIERALLRKHKETGNTVIDTVVEKIVGRLDTNGSTGDLRVLADIMGELTQKVQHEGLPTTVAVSLNDPNAKAGLEKALRTGAKPRKPKDEE